jgi:hypothetical protein
MRGLRLGRCASEMVGQRTEAVLGPPYLLESPPLE